jgi:inhibitor of cysteine peptidase
MMKTRKYLSYLLILALVTPALIASACLAPEDEVEISLAPIHEVEVFFMESFPVQVGVYIKGGLRDGCTTFHDAVVTREGNTINIEVTTQHPKDTDCPPVYNFFEKNLNLGSDFTAGATYKLEVNDYTTTFLYP